MDVQNNKVLSKTVNVIFAIFIHFYDNFLDFPFMLRYNGSTGGTNE